MFCKATGVFVREMLSSVVQLGSAWLRGIVPPCGVPPRTPTRTSLSGREVEGAGHKANLGF